MCSRREEYSLYPARLNLNSAIYLQELSNEQIENYLVKVNRLPLWQVLRVDTELLGLVRQPLLLSITLIAYREELAQRWQMLSSTQERLEFLLDAYVEKMLYRQVKRKFYVDQKEPTPQQSRWWLMKLAKQLHHDNETELIIEKMQPTWLRSTYQKWAYRLIFRLLVGLLVGLLLGLIFALMGGLTGGLTGGLIGGLIGVSFGLVFGLVFGLTFARDRIEPIEIIKFSIKSKTLQNIIAILTFGLIGGLILGLIGGLIFGLEGGLVCGLLGLSNPVIFGLVNASKAQIKIRTHPNQGMISSAKNAVIVTSISFLITFPFIGFLSKWIIDSLNRTDLTYALALSFASIIGLSLQEGGGQACIQHFSLRLILFFSHAIPWNYARFLNYATERMFLQRIGGRYRFIHKLLQDHFAQMQE